MDVFDLAAKITLDSGEYESALSKAASSTDSLASKMGSAFKNLAVVGTAALGSISAALGAISKAAVTEFADFEQLTGGIDTLFKASSQALQTQADNAFKTAGMSANQYMETATSFAGALLQSLGQDTAAAAAYADTAITDMSDNANKMGTAMDSIIATYQSLSRGNYAMLDNLKLGYGGTKTELERLLEDADALSESFNLMRDENGKVAYSFADIVDAIHIVQTEMGITGTTAQEAASTISGSVASMKAAGANWLVGLADEGADLSGLTDNLIASVETVIGNVMPVLGRIKDSLATVFVDVVQEFIGIDLSPVLDKFNQLGTAAGEIGSSIASAFRDGGFSGAMQEISGLAGQAVDAIVAKFEEISGIDLSGFFDAISGIGSKIGEVFSSIDFSGIADTISGVIDTIKSAVESIDFSGIRDGIGGIIDTVKGIIESIDFTAISEGVMSTMEGLAGLGEAVLGALAALGEYFMTLWNTILQPIVQFIAVELIENIDTAFQSLKIVFDTVVGALTEAFEAIKNSAKAATALLKGDFEGAATAIMAAWGDVLGFFGEIVSGIRGMFENLVSSMADFGKRMWEGLKSGLSSAVEGVKELGSNIISGVKNVFGIHSPSRVFMEIGEYMVQGLEKGWNNSIGAFVSDVKSTMSPDSLINGWHDAYTGDLSKVFGEDFAAHVVSRVDYRDSAVGKSSAASISAALASAASEGRTQTINLNVDGRAMASVIFDPLTGVAKQKGVMIGA